MKTPNARSTPTRLLVVHRCLYPSPMRVLLVLVLLLTGCAAPASDETASEASGLAPATQAVPRATPNPCKQGLTHLGGFTAQLAKNLDALRPLVVSARFDSPHTANANAQVTTTINTYRRAAITTALEACPSTRELAATTDGLMQKAESILMTLDGAGIHSGEAQRATAAGLYGLLPDVLTLAANGRSVAAELGVPTDGEIALAYEPVGALPPLPTPMPRPTPPPPRATPRPVAGGGGSGSSGSGSGSAANKRVVDAYYQRIEATYPILAFSGDGGATCGSPGHLDPDLNGETRAACQTYFEAQHKALEAIPDHRRWIDDHPLACLSDAYSADLALLNYVEPIVMFGFVPTDTSYRDVQSRIDTFIKRLPAYVSDCFG